MDVGDTKLITNMKVKKKYNFRQMKVCADGNLKKDVFK